LATLCSRILGLGREQVFAFLFGAGNATDAFNIAFRIPNLLRDLFAEGAMSAAFVPNFTRALVDSKRAAFRLLAAVLSVLVVTVSVISFIGILAGEPLVALYASSFKSVPGKFELSVGLTRLMFPFFPMVAVAAVLMGALNALGSFFLPAFAPALFNVASILAGFTVCPLLARYTDIPPIYGMAVGVLVGGFLQFSVQWFQLHRQGFSLRKEAASVFHPLNVPGVKLVLKLLVPGTIGLAATQLGILINSIYATGAGTGAVSWLNYAFRLMQFPIGIFGVSLAAATLPQVSRKLAMSDLRGAGAEVNNSLRMSFAVNGPATAGLMAVGLPIVQLLFQHGRFSFSDSEQTAAAVFWYALGLPGYSAVKVLVPVFYALGDTKVPVLISFAMVGLTAILNHWFLDILHYPFWCLAAATSLTATLNAVFLSVIVSKKLPGSINTQLFRSLVLQLALSGVIAFAGHASAQWVGGAHEWFESFWMGRFVLWGAQIAAAMVAAGVIWIGIGMLFRLEENQRVARFFHQFIEKRLRRTP
jgi:putative peptidoglycan lipid II flippase